MDSSKLGTGCFSNTSIIYRLTKTHVYSFYFIYLFLIIVCTLKSLVNHTWISFLEGILIGFSGWTLFEYLMHRFIFHWKAGSKFEKIIVFMLHEVHHIYPRDISRSISPLFISLPLALSFYFLFKLILGWSALPIYLGFLLGYLIYTIVHDSTHHLPMNFLLLKSLKRHHMRHHYFNNHKNFGVTSPLWDYIFHTKC